MLINKSNYEFFAIDYVEGTLSAQELRAMQAFLRAHPDIEAELVALKANLFAFEADENIVYENKQRLLKKEEVAVIVPMRARAWYKFAAAAAVAILLIGFAAGYFSAYHFEQENTVANVEYISPVLDQEEEVNTKVALEEETANTPEEQLVKTVISQQEPAQSLQDKRVSNTTLMPNLPSLPSDLAVEEMPKQNQLPLLKAEIPKQPMVDNMGSSMFSASTDVVTPLPKKPFTQLASTPLPKPNFDTQRMAKLDRSRILDFDRIKNFIGRLPFEDATLDAFVPTYLSDE
ncbi:MAG: hypothetical protein AAF849_15955 [Bacteroidota bacterium]